MHVHPPGELGNIQLLLIYRKSHGSVIISSMGSSEYMKPNGILTISHPVMRCQLACQY